MTSLRQFEPPDLLALNLTNLDPLVENYNVDFYLHYVTKWPSLFTVAENASGNVIVMGKVEEDPTWMRLAPHYLPWHGHVTALTVSPQYRRLGLAQLLTAAFESGCEVEDGWFVDLFVREGNDTAVELYKGMGYSVFRRVLGYYSDDPTGQKDCEHAFDMRKPLSRDKRRQHVRRDGTSYSIFPEDIYHG